MATLLSFSNHLIFLTTMLPCASCNKMFPTQRSLSSHSARFLKNKMLNLLNILDRTTKCSKSQRSKQFHTEQEGRGDEAWGTDHDEMDVDFDLAINEVCQDPRLLE